MTNEIRISIIFTNRWNDDYKAYYELYLNEAIETLDKLIDENNINLIDLNFNNNVHCNFDKYSLNIIEKLNERKQLGTDLLVLLKKNRHEIIEMLKEINKIRDKEITVFTRWVTENVIPSTLKSKVYYINDGKIIDVLEVSLPSYSEDLIATGVEFSLLMSQLVNIVINNSYRR